jgi:transposase
MGCSKSEVYYSAGLYEGEGNACIHKAYARKDGTVVHKLKVRVIMCDTEPLEKMKQLWGGGVTRDSKPQSEKHRQAYCWYIADSRAVRFLKKLYPLLSPRRQAQIAAVLNDKRITRHTLS